MWNGADFLFPSNIGRGAEAASGKHKCWSYAREIWGLHVWIAAMRFLTRNFDGKTANRRCGFELNVRQPVPTNHTTYSKYYNKISYTYVFRKFSRILLSTSSFECF